MKAKYYYIAIFNFFIAALLGLLLRLWQISPIENINFSFILHGHSHVAMLGWIYIILYLLLIDCFGLKTHKENLFYKRLFWITQFSVIGMMLSFPFQGYAAASISFSTLHIFCSYTFAYRLLKNNNIVSKQYRLLLKTALGFMLLSTLGVWCLGPAVGLMGKTSAFYQIAIQFFLHFQFNGWFLVASLTLFLYFYNNKILIKNFNFIYTILVISIVLTLALPVSWFIENHLLYWVNLLGTIMQTGIFFLLAINSSKYFTPFWKEQNNIEKMLLIFALGSLLIRLLLQLSTILPQIGESIHQIRTLIIGFIHLNMLGFISSLFFWILIKKQIIDIKRQISIFGIYVFLITYIATEILLFIQGMLLFFGIGVIQNYTWIMFLVSIGLPLGLLAILISSFTYSNKIYRKI